MCDLPVLKIPLVGKNGKGKFALVDGDYDGEYISQYRWCYDPRTGYAKAKINGKNVYLHHLAGGMAPPGMWTDHKNRIKLDCRSCNLRWVTPSRSALNRHQALPKNARPYRGVSQGGSVVQGKRYFSSKWVAQCDSKYVGSYSTPEEAARAYDRAARATWGDDAVLNFPTE
jgi:hypothetical protein